MLNRKHKIPKLKFPKKNVSHFKVTRTRSETKVKKKKIHSKPISRFNLTPFLRKLVFGIWALKLQIGFKLKPKKLCIKLSLLDKIH